jgi:hypothetical protein
MADESKIPFRRPKYLFPMDLTNMMDSVAVIPMNMLGDSYRI